MLIQFTLENFKAFRDEATLDFTAENLSEARESLITSSYSSETFLPVAALYGPNGGGKSTVLDAFVYFTSQIIMPVAVLIENSEDEEKNGELSMRQAQAILNRHYSNCFYKFDEESADRPIRFSMLFQTEQWRYRYELAVVRNVIQEENLYMQDLEQDKVVALIERRGEVCTLWEGFNAPASEHVKQTMPMLAFLAVNYHFPEINRVIDCFLATRAINVDMKKRGLDELFSFTGDKALKKVVLSALAVMDVNVKDIVLEKDEDGKIIKAETVHRLPGGREYHLPYQMESAGTKKLFSILPDVLRILKRGGILLVDELDANLHPKLLRTIIEMFTNPKLNIKGAQLIFTSQDVSTMKSEIFRRDEIWFCAQNARQRAHLYPLSAFRKENGKHVRKDESYDKQYIEGRYGADPYLRRILDWGDLGEPKAKKEG